MAQIKLFLHALQLEFGFLLLEFRLLGSCSTLALQLLLMNLDDLSVCSAVKLLPSLAGVLFLVYHGAIVEER